MRASSPALNESVFEKELAAAETRAAANAASGAATGDARGLPTAAAGVEPMTLAGTVGACAALLLILLIAAVIGWNAVDVSAFEVSVPIWYWIALIGGLVVAVVTIFRPRIAPWTGPLYAALEGVLIGGISRIFEFEFEGIVLQATALTVGVFCVLLALYATRVVKVTENFRLGVIAATGAIALVYIFDLILHAFGSNVPFIHETGTVGIIVSVVIVIIASLNLVLDFDFIENGVDQRAPAYMNWYAAFGLLVTLVWLYLEMLRLLGKLRSNN